MRTLPLRRSWLERARALTASDPVVNVHVASVLSPRGPFGRALRGLWLVEERGEPLAVAQHRRGISFAAAPGRASDPALAAPLTRIVTRELRGSDVLFGEERLIRTILASARDRGVHVVELRSQELLTAPERQRPPGTAPVAGFRLRPARPDDLPWLLEAHAAMCREDLGVDQVSRNRAGYGEYFKALTGAGRSVIGEIDGRSVFKAEYAVESDRARLVEGVWTAHDVRRRGLAGWSMRVLAAQARRAGLASCLYVHRRNGPARRVYRRAGFRAVCPWITALVTDDPRGSRGAGHA